MGGFLFYRVKKLFKFYRLLNVLSIDVALGAVCSSVWLAQYFQIQVHSQTYLALGLTVWIIYTTDHLLDARRIAHGAATIRHQFHQKNFRLVLAFLLIIGLTDGVVVSFVGDSIFFSGLMLAMVIGVYLLFNKWLGCVKEFFVAILYCGGILLPVLSLGGIDVLLFNIPLVVSFFITAFINVILFSWYERTSDKQDHSTSIAVSLGTPATDRVLQILFIVQAGFILYTAFYSLQASVLLGFMNFILVVLFLKPRFFVRAEVYRLVGDSIFLFPVLTLF